jgi:trimethylguanosine synthase
MELHMRRWQSMISQFVLPKYGHSDRFLHDHRKIAEHIATAAPANRSIMLDPFCGAGGNAIAFALSGRWKRVYAIEKDPATLECAMQNARIYGVHDQITWFEGDCFEILGLGNGDKEKEVGALKSVIEQYGVMFASPPWGGESLDLQDKMSSASGIFQQPLTDFLGPGYKSEAVFNLDNMQPYSLRYMFERFKGLAKNMVFYLPRTSDLQQIAECVGKDEKAQVVHYCTNGGSRALCAYLGDWGTVHPKSK